MFCHATDSAIWYTMWDGSTWESWTSLGGAISTAPGASDWEDASGAWQLNLVANVETGADWQKYRNSFNPWSDWIAQGGSCDSGPSDRELTELANAQFFVLCRFYDVSTFDSDYVEYKRWNGSGWDPWVSIGKP